MGLPSSLLDFRWFKNRDIWKLEPISSISDHLLFPQMADNLTQPWSDSPSFWVLVTQYVGASYELLVLRSLWPVSGSLSQKFVHFFHQEKKKKDFIS